MLANGVYSFRYTNALLSKDKDVVVLGGSFVAMEAANYCQNKVNRVTVILRDDLPFRPLLGPEIGAAFKKLFEDKGVHFVTNTSISKINGDNGNVVSVDLINGMIAYYTLHKELTTTIDYYNHIFTQYIDL